MGKCTRIGIVLLCVAGLVLPCLRSLQAETLDLNDPSSYENVEGITIEYEYEERLYELNQQGIECFNNEQYAEAIAIFREAATIVPDDKTVQNNLLAAYSYIALDHMNNKEYTQALEYFEEALRITPGDVNLQRNIAFIYMNMASERFDTDNDLDATISFLTKGLTYDSGNETIKKQLAMFLYNKAMKFYADRDYEQAKAYLSESLKHNAVQSFTYEVLGDIAFYEHQLVDAQKYWEEAATLEPSTRLREKVAKLERDIVVDEELKEYPAKKFMIKYVPGYDLYRGYKIREILREAYRKVGRDFNYYPKYKIVALLYNEDHFSKFVDGYWVTAAYDGKIRLPQENIGVTDTRIRALAFHEYTHALVQDLSGGKAPVWLAEGLAQYQENKISPIDMKLLKIKYMSGHVFNLKVDLAGSPVGLPYESMKEYYLASFTLTQYLIKRYRIFKIKELMSLMKEGDDFEAALKKSLFLSVERLNKKWNESLTTAFTGDK